MKTERLLPLYNVLAVLSFILVIIFSTQFLTQNSLKIWPDYISMQNLSTPSEWIRWFLGDMSEAQFYKNELATLGLLLGAFIAFILSKKNKVWKGFELSYGTGLFPWILFSSSLGLLLSNLLWGWLIINTHQWQPTFVAFVSLPAAIVLMYGRGFKIALLGAISGAIIICPISLLLVNFLCIPFNIPNIIGNVSGMAIGSLITFKTLHILQPIWIRTQQNSIPKDNNIESNIPSSNPTNFGPLWSVRRMLSDFTESQFFANELAGIGYLVGVLLAIYVNPFSISYGSGLIGKILISQTLTSGIAIILWRKKWIKYGWYPTYIPISSVAPATVLIFQGNMLSIILGAVFGALIAPPLAKSISNYLPSYQHSYIGNVISMAITTIITIYLISFLSYYL